MSIAAGDTVRYTSEFVRSLGKWGPDNVEGTVISLFGRSVKVARVRWQDGSIQSVLVSNLEKWPPRYREPDFDMSRFQPPSQEEIMLNRGLILIEWMLKNGMARVRTEKEMSNGALSDQTRAEA